MREDHTMTLLSRPASMIHAFLVAVGLAVGLVACTPRVAGTTIETAPSPSAENPAVRAVQAYLHTFKLNEKELPEDLTIPYVRSGEGFSWVGAARVTGKIGPQGHRVYEVVVVTGSIGAAGEGVGLHAFMEIAPEPEATPAVAAPSPSATPAPPASGAR
jgi:hypothetical protein